MTFEEFMKTPECKIGNIVWVCDYRYNDLSLSKPIRHVPPTEVEIWSNDDLPKNKRVYYSSIHFRPIGKKVVIAPFDNTGFRSYTGVSLNVFLTEKEAKDHYRVACKNLIGDLQQEKIKVAQDFDDKIKKITDQMGSV